MSEKEHYKYSGPYGRYFKAKDIIAGKASPSKDDLWVIKLVDILKLYYVYDKKSDGLDLFRRDWPLYYDLVTTFFDGSTGSEKEMLEACLLCSNNYASIADTIAVSRITPEFVYLYKELFYNVDTLENNPAMFFRYIILPMTQKDTDNIAIGSIWKLLASCGGLRRLKEKGFGSSPIKADEDLNYLLQLVSMRNCTMLLKYSASGLNMIDEHPNAGLVFDRLMEFDGLRGSERRSDGFAKLSVTSLNEFNNMLSYGIKLISQPKDLAESVFRLDGEFHPETEESIEKIKHLTLEGGTENE